MTNDFDICKWVMGRMQTLPSCGPFCQVLVFSAKFVACLPTLVQTLQSFCQVFGSFYQVHGSELAKNCQLEQVDKFLPTRWIPSWACAMTPSWKNILVGRAWQTWQKGHELGRSKPRKRKWGEPLVLRGTKEFTPPPPPARVRQPRFPPRQWCRLNLHRTSDTWKRDISREREMRWI